MLNEKKFTFGSDPEFFLINEKGSYKSAIGVINGTKEHKISLRGGHKAFYDNVLAEVNIKPGKNKTEVISNFRDCFAKLAKLVGKLKLAPQASQIYPSEECSHPDALIFGCLPEYCIYNKDENGRIQMIDPPVVDPNNTFRSAGGHIHLGSDLALANPIVTVQLLDLFVGVPSVCIDHDPTSPARRKLYGGAGTHRPTGYGIEYRPLSNFWIASPVLVSMIYDLCTFVIELMEKGKEIIDIKPDEIQNIINSGDRDTATKYLTKGICKKYLPKGLHNRLMELTKAREYSFYVEWSL